MIIWLTGLPSSGKSTLAQAVHQALFSRGLPSDWLDGDLARQDLSPDLGFSRCDRDQHVRRLGFLAGRLSAHSIITLVSAISPYRETREEVRRKAPGVFIEVYVDAPLATCESRDVKGIYRRARAGELQSVTGIDDPYEAPLRPEVWCHTDVETLEESVAKVLLRVCIMAASCTSGGGI